MDLLVIHPGAQHGIYGELGDRLTALEPPTWARMVAGYIRDRGASVAILDAEAERLSPADVYVEVASYQPRLVAIVVSGHQPSASTQQMVSAGEIARTIKANLPEQRIIMCGNHPSALPKRTLREEAVDYVADGEGMITIAGILAGDKVGDIPGLVWRTSDLGKIVSNPPAPLVADLDRDLRGDAWDLLPMERYRAHNWHTFAGLPRQPYASVYTSLGCPYKCTFCLAGDTEVNTIYGPIAIRNLVEQSIIDIPIFTLDTEKQRGLVSVANNIRQYGTDRLVRVNFDDGSHLDCTPDHKLLRFTYSKKRDQQIPTEARNLKTGDRVRAINFNYKGNYPYVSFGVKSGGAHVHRLVASWKLNRPLTKEDIIHHIDHDRQNWSPDNLDTFSSHTEHAAHHDMSGRIKDYWDSVRFIGLEKPTKLEAYRRAAIEREAKTRGLKRWWTEPDGSIHMSLAPRDPLAIAGKKNGIWWTRSDGSTYQSFAPRHADDIKGRSNFNPHKNWEKNANHKIVSVIELEGEHPVYCLDVPETGWFYANNVLVKNCMINSFQHENKYRMFSPAFIVKEIKRLHDDYGVKNLKIADEMFCLNRAHVTEICEGLVGLNLDLNIWAYSRVDTVMPDLLSLMRRAGIQWLALGIESGSAHVRDGAGKRLRTGDIVDVVRTIQAEGISVIGNFMFGLRDDTVDTMRATLDLALACLPEFANFYSCHAYPGSALYDQALREEWTLPDSWAGFSQHNSECRPMDTEHVDAATVLRFRDAAFRAYFSAPAYRDLVRRRFGADAEGEIERMLSYRLKRKLLGTA